MSSCLPGKHCAAELYPGCSDSHNKKFASVGWVESFNMHGESTFILSPEIHVEIQVIRIVSFLTPGITDNGIC